MRRLRRALPSLPGPRLTEDKGTQRADATGDLATEKKQHPVATIGLPLFRMLLKFVMALLLKHIIFSINRIAEPRPGSFSDETRSFYHHKFIPLRT